MSQEAQSFEPFASEAAYIHLNERMVDRVLRRIGSVQTIRLLDVAAGTGLLTSIAYERAKEAGVRLLSTLLDLDLPALKQARKDATADGAEYIFGSADHLPLKQKFDAVIFANGLHLLDEDAKVQALQETWRVLRPGGVFAMNTTFYEGAYPEESKPFYSRWMRRAIVEINRRLPQRSKSEKVQAMEWLPAIGYKELIAKAGFKVLEMRERRVLLSQAAVRAICAYKEFAKGALHATDEDANDASQALQAMVQQTFRDLKMKYLPRNWLEIVAVKA